MTEQLLTILPPELKGTVLVTGELGIGKTTFALTCELPANICFVDLDEKGKGISDQLGIGEYFAPTTVTSEPNRVYEMFDEWLTNLPENKYTVCVIDNISVLEDGLEQRIKMNAKFYADKYGAREENIHKGSYGGARTVSNKILSELIARFRSKGINLVIQIAHTGNNWSGGQPVPGKRRIKGLSKWNTLSVLSLVLIPARANEPQDGAPAALVRKESIPKMIVNDAISPEKAKRMASGEGGIHIKRRLPRRIYPATWQKIKQYLNKPADFENPKTEEVPTNAEIAPYEERLSEEQFSYINNSLALAAAEANREKTMSHEEISAELLKISEMAEKMNGYQGDMTPIAVRDALIGHGYQCDIPLAVRVMNMLKEKE